MTKRKGLLTAAAVLMAWLASGWYVVESDQVGLVRRWGRLVDEPAGPGLHYDLPWPWSVVDRVRRDETRQVSVGVALEGEQIMAATSEERRSEFFTGDQNLIHIQATLQYRIADVAPYTLGQATAEELLYVILESSLTDAVATTGVDSLLTDGRSQVQRLALDRIQSLADDYQLGVTALTVDLSSIRPPAEVQPDFQQAVNARSDKERYIHDAHSQRLEKQALASGERQRLLDEAASYRDRLIQQSKGDARYFNSTIDEFTLITLAASRQQARQMTMSRLWYETLSRLLPRFKRKLFVDPGDKVDVLIPRE